MHQTSCSKRVSTTNLLFLTQRELFVKTHVVLKENSIVMRNAAYTVDTPKQLLEPDQLPNSVVEQDLQIKLCCAFVEISSVWCTLNQFLIVLQQLNFILSHWNDSTQFQLRVILLQSIGEFKHVVESRPHIARISVNKFGELDGLQLLPSPTQRLGPTPFDYYLFRYGLSSIFMILHRKE